MDVDIGIFNIVSRNKIFYSRISSPFDKRLSPFKNVSINQSQIFYILLRSSFKLHRNFLAIYTSLFILFSVSELLFYKSSPMHENRGLQIFFTPFYYQVKSYNHSNISFKIMTQPDPQLLSLLEKAANPIQEVTLKIKINGVYAPPQQWKITDQANPNVFGYSVKILGQDFIGGKIQPRKLTEKQQKELQEKGKKGGKKQPKQEEKAPQVDPVEQQRRQREWNALSEQQRFYRTQQDPYKAFSLNLTQKNKQINLTRQKIPELEQKISNDAIQITLTRKPETSEQDLQKLKKSKPKNLNVGQLYAAVYKGTIKAKQLQRPGSTKIVQRVKLSFGGQVPDDGIKIQTENCYIYLQIQCSQPLTPQVKQIKPQTTQIIPEFVNKSGQEPSPVVRLKQQLCKSIRAISQQYITCFSKQKQHTEDKRHSNPNNISTLRLNQINKRKQIFLNDFVSSGKFNLLKERIAKSLKAVIIDKFRKEKQGSTFSRQQINETLSQLNLYFQQEFTKTIDEFMVGDSTSIHEDLVLGYEHSRQSRKNAIAPLSNETQIQREARLANQYQILQKQNNEGSEYKAQKHYINILVLSKYSIQAKQEYAKFCLRCKNFNKAFILYSEISEESQQLNHRFIQAVLLVDRRRKEEATNLLQKMMLDPECQTASKINYNLLLSFMHQRQNDIKNSQKYLAIAERYYKMKNNPHMKFTPVQNPYQLPKPKVPKPERYVSQLSHIESQQIRLNFINMLADLNLYVLVRQYLPKIDESNKKTILEIQADMFDNNFDEALNKIQLFLKKADNIRNVDYLMIKADICYRADKMFQCEEIFLQILQSKPHAQKIIQVYLRLGYIYLSRKSWEDAKEVFEKAVEQKYNCSVAWQGLGISSLHLEKYNEAEEALNLSNIYNPLSEQTKQYQDEVNKQQRRKYEVLDQY